jgi:hypothetical protein
MSDQYSGPPQYGPPYQPPMGQPYQPEYQPAPPLYGQPYGWVAPPPPKPRRTGTWIAIGVSALVVVFLVIIGAVAIVAHSGGRTGPDRSLTTPGQFGSHSLLTNDAAANVKARVKDSFLGSNSTAAKVLSNAQIGVYGPADADDQPSVIFFGVDASDSSAARNLLHGETDRAHTNEFLDGSDATGITEYDAGPLGGSLKCGKVSGTNAVCVWSDYSTLGVLIFYDSTSQAQAAEDALALRTAAEH